MSEDKPDLSKVKLIKVDPPPPKPEVPIITHFIPDPPIDPSYYDPQGMELFPPDVKLYGHDGFIHIEQGRQELARYFAQPKLGIPNIPVIIRADIAQKWDADSGRSQEFRISIGSIEQDHSHYDERDWPLQDLFADGLDRLIKEYRARGLSDKDIQHQLRHWAEYLQKRMKHGDPS